MSDIFDAPNQMICVNEDWIPVLVGAMKLLLTDEVWDTTNPEVAQDMQSQVNMLISSWDDCCTDINLTDWFMNLYVIDGEIEYNFPSPSGTDLTMQADFATLTAKVIDSTEPPEPLNMVISMYERGTTIFAGGVINEFIFECDDVLDAIHLDIIDCLDNHTYWDGFNAVTFTDVFPLDTEKAIKEIDILTGTIAMTIYIRGNGPLVCGGA